MNERQWISVGVLTASYQKWQHEPDCELTNDRPTAGTRCTEDIWPHKKEIQVAAGTLLQ